MKHLSPMNTHLLTTVAFTMLCVTASAQFPKLNYKKINAQAAKEYLTPIRPGYEGRNPYWNAYATRFLYAPAFDFKEVAGAANYIYSVKAAGKTYTFRAAKPGLSLAPIWNKIPAGVNATLTVKAVNADGSVINDAVGTRTFFRDYPFRGPYNLPASTYKDCAVKALKFIHNIPQIRRWAEQQVPDMSFSLNTYPCKTVSATIRCELMLAKESPADSALAMKIAKNAGEFMLKVSWPEKDALAFFPPTYYGNLHASANNNGMTMSMEACKAAQAFLDLYDATGDGRYMKQVKGILSTYRRLQNSDGGVPIKLYISSGKGVNEVCARLHPLLGVLRRMHDQYGMTEYEDMRHAAEHWMENIAFNKFEMVGQFEDTPVEGLKPYQNLSHWTGVPYAIYVLESGHPTKEQIKMAREVINFGEDQFTIWELGPESLGFGSWLVPAVEEQYFYRMAVDDSAASMADAYLNLWLVTGDKLALAKGIALINSITRVQKPSGLIPTAWENGGSDNPADVWISCCMGDIFTLLKYAKHAGNMTVDKHLADLLGSVSPDAYAYGQSPGFYSDSTAVKQLKKTYRNILESYLNASTEERAHMSAELAAAKSSVERSLIRIKEDDGYYITSGYNGFIAKGNTDEALYAASPDGKLEFKKIDRSDKRFVWRIKEAGTWNGKTAYTIENVGNGAYINKSRDGKRLSPVSCSSTPQTLQILRRNGGNSPYWTITNTVDKTSYNPKLSDGTIVLYDDKNGSLWRLVKAPRNMSLPK